MAKSVPYSERKFDRKHQTEYNQEFRKNNYDRVEFLLPKGYKDIIKGQSANEGLPMSEWIRILIDERLNKQ